MCSRIKLKTATLGRPNTDAAASWQRRPLPPLLSISAIKYSHLCSPTECQLNYWKTCLQPAVQLSAQYQSTIDNSVRSCRRDSVLWEQLTGVVLQCAWRHVSYCPPAFSPLILALSTSRLYRDAQTASRKWAATKRAVKNLHVFPPNILTTDYLILRMKNTNNFEVEFHTE